MAMKTVGDIFKVMGEVDLNEIKKEAEQPFSLFLTGETTLLEEFANHLSQEPGKSGLHPWLVIEELPIKLDNLRWASPDMAFLIISEPELMPTQKDALDHFYDAKIPTIVIVVNEIAETLRGAELPRKKESARVVLATCDAELIQLKLSSAIVKLAPDQYKLSLARQFPLFRDPIIAELIEKTSYANAAYAASSGVAEAIPAVNIPLNMADIVLLTKNQLILAYKVALAHGKEGEPIAVIGEIVGVFGQAFFFREIARQLVGFIPIIGIVPKIAVSYSGTWIIGQTTHLWAKNGDILEPAQISELYQETLVRGQELAQSLIRLPWRQSAAIGTDVTGADETLLLLEEDTEEDTLEDAEEDDQEHTQEDAQEKEKWWKKPLKLFPSYNNPLLRLQEEAQEETQQEAQQEAERKGNWWKKPLTWFPSYNK